MGLLSIGLFLICPLIAVIVAAIGLIIGKEKHHKIYFLIIAFALAIIAYYFNPSSSDDLFRHHNDVITISNMSQTRIFGRAYWKCRFTTIYNNIYKLYNYVLFD